MDKFQAHIAKSKTIEIEREGKEGQTEKDIFTLEPLDFKFMPKVFTLMKNMSKLAGMKDTKLDEMEDTDIEKFFEVFDESTMELVRELTLEMLYKSYPNEDKLKLEQFAASNVMKLFPVLLELNSPTK